MKKKFSIGRMLILAVLLVYTVFLFFPIITILITSFTPGEELIANKDFVWWSQNMTLDAYRNIFLNDQYMAWIGIPGLIYALYNTLWITLIPLLIGLVVSGASAYAFSKSDFPFKNALFKLSVIIRAIPLGAFGIISFVFYSAIGWTGDNGVLPLVVPGCLGSLSTVFFLRLYFDGIPNSLIEAATLDGAGFFKCFTSIMVPLAKPAFIAQFIFGFVGGYNSYIGPLLYLNGNERYITIQMYLSNITSFFSDSGPGSQNIHCAAAVLGMLPLILIYCLLQKYFIEGVATGGVKE